MRAPASIMEVLTMRGWLEVRVRRRKSQNTIIMTIYGRLFQRGITIGYLVFSNHTLLLNNYYRRKDSLNL